MTSSPPSRPPSPISMSLPVAARALFDGAALGHLSTLQADGSPRVEPVWVGRDGDAVLVATDGATHKAANVRRDPRVALSITAPGNPYEQLVLRGVARVVPDDDLVVLDALSRRYLGQPFPRRRWGERIVLRIEATSVRHHVSPLSLDPATPGDPA